METHASRSFQTNLNSSNDTGGEILSISLVNCDTVSLIFVHDSSAFERGRHTFHPTRILPERRKSEATVSPSPIIDNWKTVNARSNCIRGFPKRSRLDNKQNLSHGKKWKRRITSRRSIIPSLLVYKSSEFHPSIHPSLSPFIVSNNRITEAGSVYRRQTPILSRCCEILMAISTRWKERTIESGRRYRQEIDLPTRLNGITPPFIDYTFSYRLINRGSRGLLARIA